MMVVVQEIEDQTTAKPFLGGWRDVEREIEYHDAASQTTPRQQRGVSVPVQTSARPRRSRSTDALGIERGVQAGPPFPQLGEIVLPPTDLQLVRRREKAAALIQRCFRAHRGRRAAGEVESRSGVKFDDTSGGGAADEPDEDRSLSITESKDYRRESCSYGEFDLVEPRSARADDSADLAVLRSLVDRWGVAEEARIRGEMHETRSRIAAQSQRLQQEVEILRAIDTSRTEVSRRRAERARGKFLDELAKPIDLDVPLSEEQSKRGTVHVETLNVQRAREFRELYDALASGEADEEDEGETDEFDRIELLFAAKKIAWQHTCPASSNLENLIDQELFLMSSRVQAPRLRHLRSRVRLGFLRLARGALRHDNGIKSSSGTRFCLSCRRLKRLEAYEADHRGRVSRTCVDCSALRTKRRELELCSEIYERMLNELRRSESAKTNGPSSLAFAVGAKAIRYLVNDIWHARSVFSECADLEQLRLARLDPAEPWSPWNTLLATRREARMHEALARDVDAVGQVYDAELARKLRRMNLQARLYFETLAKNERP